MGDNSLFEAIDKLYSLLIKERDIVNVSHVEVIGYKKDNFRLW